MMKLYIRKLLVILVAFLLFYVMSILALGLITLYERRTDLVSFKDIAKATAGFDVTIIMLISFGYSIYRIGRFIDI